MIYRRELEQESLMVISSEFSTFLMYYCRICPSLKTEDIVQYFLEGILFRLIESGCSYLNACFRQADWWDSIVITVDRFL